jgi:hypothetical protein
MWLVAATFSDPPIDGTKHRCYSRILKGKCSINIGFFAANAEESAVDCDLTRERNVFVCFFLIT